MMSCRRVQTVSPSPVTSGLSVKKPGGLCLRSLQLDLPLRSLAGQNLTAGRRCSEMSGVGMDTRPLGLSRVLRSWNPSPATPFPAPTSALDTQSLRLSSAVSSLCCPHPERSPCGPQVRLCQLKPRMELCQEGLVGVLPAAGVILGPSKPLRHRAGMSTAACTVVKAVPLRDSCSEDSHSPFAHFFTRHPCQAWGQGLVL